jgi:ribonuclease E
MAGLIVIDFIDMEQSSHVRKVEKAMKDALRNDRARIQIGRISSFGLLEMSRQRLRTGVLEASTKPCPHCDGSGLMRTASSAGLSALRIIEDEATRGRGDKIVLRAGKDAGVYVLNKKRAELADIELRYGVSIEVVIDETFEGARMTVESSGPRPIAGPQPEPAFVEDEPDDELEETEAEEDEAAGSEERVSEGEQQGRKRRRRRRGGRGRSRRESEDGQAPEQIAEMPEQTAEPGALESTEEVAPEPAKRRRRRRGRKAGDAPESEVVEPESSPMVERPIAEEPPIAETVAEEPKPKPRRRKRVVEADAVEPEATEPAAVEATEAEIPSEIAKPARKRRSKTAAGAEPASSASAPAPAANDANGNSGSDEPRRSGWWQRTFG